MKVNFVFDEYKLSDNLDIELSFRNGLIFITCEQLNHTFGYGHTLQDAAIDFKENIDYLFETFVNCDQSKLAPSAVEYGKFIKDNIEVIDYVH